MAALPLPIRQRQKTGSGLIHSIVKEQVLPGQLEGTTDNHQVYTITA